MRCRTLTPCHTVGPQAGNKERALAILRARVFEVEMQRRNDEIASKRKNQVGRCPAVRSAASRALPVTHNGAGPAGLQHMPPPRPAPRACAGGHW